MLYMGRRRDSGEFGLLAARSSDGIAFEPMDLGGGGGRACNLIMTLKGGQEPLCVYEDALAAPEERYRMILTCLDGERFRVSGRVYVSADLVHWTMFPEDIPGWSCEPVGGAFYNDVRGCHTILHRQTWGNRCVGYRDTKDFRSY